MRISDWSSVECSSDLRLAANRWTGACEGTSITEYHLVVTEGSVATSVKLDPELVDRLRRLAGRRQRSPHAMMREAIQTYVEREEARESFQEEAQIGNASCRERGCKYV